MVVLCANVFCLSAANVPPYSGTNDKTNRASEDCCKVSGMPVHVFGRVRPSEYPIRKGSLRQD